MKKLILFLTCLPQLLWAQVDYQYVSPLKFDAYHTVAANQMGQIVVGGSTLSCPKASISLLDSLGNLQWQKYSRGPLNLVTDVFFDTDNTIVAVGIENLADDFGWEEDGFFFLHLTIEGDTLSYHKQATGTSFAIRERAYLLPQNDSTYLVALRDHFYWLSKAGQLLKTQDFPLGNIVGLSAAPQDHFVVLGKAGGQLFSPSGELVQNYPSGETPFLGVAFAQDTTWFLSEKQLWMISDTTAEYQKIDLPISSRKAKISTRPARAGLVLLSQTAEEDFLLLEYLNNQWDTLDVVPALGTDPRDFKILDDRYYFVGTDLWERPPMWDPTHGAFLSITSEDYSPKDRLIDDMSLEFILAEPFGPIDTVEVFTVPFSGYNMERGYKATVTVQNTGQRAIHSFVFFSEKYGGFNCGHGSDFFYLDSLDIKVGELYTFNIDFELRYTYRDFSPNQFYDRCFYVAAPNLKFDQEIANNSSCVTLISNTKAAFTLSEKLQVFPNPASTSLNMLLDSKDPIQQIILFDLQGKQVPANIDINGQEAELDRGSLPSGIYFLKVFTKNGIGTRKVIFQ